jgi:biopolymer transport protein ExbB
MIAVGLHESHTGNFIIDNFVKGGPIMWPILLTSIIALTVILERVVWWTRQNHLRESSKLEKVFAHIEQGEIKEASALARTSQDPRLRTLWHGLNHHHSTMQSALQVASGLEIHRASRFLVVMDTIVTLAPRLGLLATACGLCIAMASLIPYNFFQSKVERLKFDLETACTNLEVMLQGLSLNLEEKHEAELRSAA